jgi:hypothetical protein
VAVVVQSTTQELPLLLELAAVVALTPLEQLTLVVAVAQESAV